MYFSFSYISTLLSPIAKSAAASASAPFSPLSYLCARCALRKIEQQNKFSLKQLQHSGRKKILVFVANNFLIERKIYSNRHKVGSDFFYKQNLTNWLDANLLEFIKSYLLESINLQSVFLRNIDTSLPTTVHFHDGSVLS